MKFTGQQWRQTENRLTDASWEQGRGEGEMYGVTRKLTLPYVKQTANGNLLYGSGNSNRGSVTTLQGWDGEGDGREVQEGGDICTPLTDSS